MKPTSAFLFSVWCGLINSSNHASAKTWLKSAASPAQGFGLTRFVGDDDDVNDGGVVDVTPLCGSSGNDCPPSEEEVQEELTAALEADEQVTGEPRLTVETHLCSSGDGIIRSIITFEYSIFSFLYTVQCRQVQGCNSVFVCRQSMLQTWDTGGLLIVPPINQRVAVSLSSRPHQRNEKASEPFHIGFFTAYLT